MRRPVSELICTNFADWARPRSEVSLHSVTSPALARTSRGRPRTMCLRLTVPRGSFGTLSVGTTAKSAVNTAFALLLTFATPDSPAATFEAAIRGTVSTMATGGLMRQFDPSVVTAAVHDNGTNGQSGTMTVYANNVSLSSGGSAALTGFIETETARTSDPDALASDSRDWWHVARSCWARLNTSEGAMRARVSVGRPQHSSVVRLTCTASVFLKLPSESRPRRFKCPVLCCVPDERIGCIGSTKPRC